MSDEEDDYMSNKFLSNCDENKPGLLPKRVAEKYRREREVKERERVNKQKPKAVVESETRKEALNTALKEDNKGFNLLKKMGYKPGNAIGKRGEGRTEPIPLEVKTDRGGLGRESELKRKAEAWSNVRAATSARRRKFEEARRGEFFGRLNTQLTDRQSNLDLIKSQKVCEQLDSECDITEPLEMYFWPDQLLPGCDEEEYAEEYESFSSAADKLRILTEYLRERHIYCLWCGIKFEDSNDMETNCPGDNYQAHS